MLSNIPKKIKFFYKPLDEFEDETGENYYEDFEVKREKKC